MSVESTLEFMRGAVRPLALVSLIGANIALIFAGVFSAEARDYVFQGLAALEGMTGIIVGWWFVERREIHIAENNLNNHSP